MNERTSAEITADSAIKALDMARFAYRVSFFTLRGFSLPPMEAMICGCVVVGYHGRGGREYFHPEFSYPVEAGDIIGFVRKAEEVIIAYRKDPDSMLEKGEKASERISLDYDARIEETDLTRIWSEILKSNPV